MKELVCNYALVRFLPYRETGEFVNVGVVLYAPEVSQFDFRLTEKRNRRVRAFFPEMDPEIYAAAVDSLRRELERQRTQFNSLGGLFNGERAVSEGLTAFRSMLRRRESLIHFAEPGMRLGIPQETLGDLFADYVLRSFAQTAEYQETIMRKRLRKCLNEWGLRNRYKSNKKVGDDQFHLTLPFVQFENEKPIAAIKPLDLNRPDPTAVYEHGGQWIQRFSRLARRGHLPPNTIVPLQFPPGAARRAADEVAAELDALGVRTADFADLGRVRELAEV
ncbi:MAG TPA: DUF3037 domain-containing protein [Tepidisphaeraceae bacterium]|nr:DUF3037 domain-containing protein [Tepidisphaeraceae bacterium]